MARSKNSALIVLALAIAASANAQTTSFTFTGIAAARENYVTGQPSWLEHGFGRLDYGASGVDETRWVPTGFLQLGGDWTPTQWLDVHASGIARHEPSSVAGGKRYGLIDAFVELHNDQFQLRAGQFFLGTSRENVGPLWSSPYTLSFSALNTWIGEEVRPVGVDLQWKPNFYVTAGATAFRNNDTAGALLAWRGWTIGNRLTAYDEVLPLPPLFSLPTGFADQRPDGTKPFGPDLDGRTGYSARLRAQIPERAMAQLTHIDNRGDRKEYRGEYAWQTRFDIIGAQLGTPSSPTTLIAEYGWGKTGMGVPPIFVNANFDAGYVLLSHVIGKERFSARYDIFATVDRDHAVGAETNTEHGRAWLLAWLHQLNPHLRAGLEFVQVTGNRIAAQESGFSPNTDAHSLIGEVRYSF